MNSREVALARVNSALPVLSQINDLYLQAVNLQQQSAVQEANIRNQSNGSPWLKGQARYAVVSLVVFALVWLCSKLPIGEKALMFIAVFLCVVGVAYCAFGKLNDQRRQSIQKNRSVQSMNNKFGAMIDRVSEEIYALACQNEAVLAQIPRDYRNYNAVSYFEHVLVNEQADSMKEAVNLYEQYMHRQRLETNQSIMLEQSRIQSQMLANIESSSQSTARSSSITATFTVLNYLNNC